MQVLTKKGNGTKKSNLKGMLLRQLAGRNANDKTALMFIATERIRSLLDSSESSDWEIGLNNLNKLLPFVISKESYDKPLFGITAGNDSQGNAQVFIQLNQFVNDRDTRKQQIDNNTSKLDVSKNIEATKKTG